MRGSIVILLLMLTLTLVLPAPASDPSPADAQRIGQLIDQLSSVKFAEREAASQMLEAIGPSALDALRKAVKSEDCEVSRRAQVLVKKLEKRREAAQLLAPLKTRLVFKDTPLEQAIGDISQKTGLIIKLDGAKGALTDRKVTLDTGETTFWEAFDQFCKKAELVEITPATTAEKAPKNNGVTGSTVIIGGGNRPVTAKDITNADNGEKPMVVTLAAGKPSELPTLYSGALRIQAALAGSDLISQKKGPGETLFALEVSAEPSIRWERVIGLRVEKAIDDQDQALSQLPTTFNKPAPPPVRNTGTITINGVTLSPDPPAPEGFQKQAPVRLKLGEKPAKAIKELSGTLIAQVRSPIEPLVTVEEVLQSAEKAFKTREGTIKMISVKRQDNGQVLVHFQIETPPRKLDDGSTPPTPNMTVIINGRQVGQAEEEPLSAANFALLDDKGRPYKVIKASNTGRQTGATQELELTFQAGAEQGEPSRFQYNGRRSAIVEVPFRLKDVPLP